jgi:hypothetical protein
MDKHAHMFEGWTVEQRLERMRLQRLPEFKEVLRELTPALGSLATMMSALPGISDPVARADAEKSVARVLGRLSRAPDLPRADTNIDAEETVATPDEVDGGDATTVEEVGGNEVEEPVETDAAAPEGETAEEVGGGDAPPPEDVGDSDATMPDEGSGGDGVVPEAIGGSGSGGDRGGDKATPEEVCGDASAPDVEADSKEGRGSDAPMPDAVPELFPPPPKRKLGRPPKPKVAPPVDAATPLQRFLDECFDAALADGVGDAKTHVAHVRARHRLWRGCNVNREETAKMVDFFQQRFRVVQEMDEGHDIKCSFYVGLAMKPWAPPDVPDADVAAFVRERCEVHVMGRVRTVDLWDAFVAWRRDGGATAAPFEATTKERMAFLAAAKAAFVYHTGVPVDRSGIGGPGFYGLYLATATRECREVGYNRSPGTHAAIVKLDAKGNVVATIESQDVFAHRVAKMSAQHVCKELTRLFREGGKGMVLPDGYCYMRASDLSQAFPGAAPSFSGCCAPAKP